MLTAVAPCMTYNIDPSGNLWLWFVLPKQEQTRATSQATGVCVHKVGSIDVFCCSSTRIGIWLFVASSKDPHKQRIWHILGFDTFRHIGTMGSGQEARVESELR